MKILHTSDWHLGHTLYNYDRTEEQRAMLGQMAEIVRTEKPDVFLLCGDVYHSAQPSATVQTMFIEALIDIRDANPEMTIIVTAGNHDSGTKHEIFRTAWRVLKVHTVGKLNKDNICDHIIEVQGKGYIIALPYSNEKSLTEDFIHKLLDTVKDRNKEELPVVMSAHTTVRGCDISGHDNTTEYMVGGIDYLDINQLGKGYDYLALGHIHHAQWIHTGKHNARYSGTPIAVSFDENYSHTVSIVEIERHGHKPELKTIEILNPRPLVTLPSDGMTDWDNAKRLLAEFPDDIPAYIRLNVEIDNFLPVEANAEATALTKNKLCHFCHINVKRKINKRSDAKILSVQEFQKINPLEIARRYAADCGIGFDDDMNKLFADAVKMVEEERRNAL